VITHSITPQGIVFNVCIVPRASRSEIVGEHYKSLKVKIAAPPVDGAANAELIKVLAKHLKVAKSCVEIIAGESSKNKRVRVTGADEAVVGALLRS